MLAEGIEGLRRPYIPSAASEVPRPRHVIPQLPNMVAFQLFITEVILVGVHEAPT